MTRYLLIPAVLLAACIALYAWLCHECQFGELWEEAYD
jgi:hypothetical protein